MNTTNSNFNSNCTLEAAGYAIPIIVASIITLIKALNGIFQVSSRGIKRMGSLRQGSRHNGHSTEDMVQDVADQSPERGSHERLPRESTRRAYQAVQGDKAEEEGRSRQTDEGTK